MWIEWKTVQIQLNSVGTIAVEMQKLCRTVANDKCRTACCNITQSRVEKSLNHHKQSNYRNIKQW